MPPEAVISEEAHATQDVQERTAASHLPSEKSYCTTGAV